MLTLPATLADDAQLGAQLRPVNLGTNQSVVSVHMGYNHTCALLATGRVKCFGSNS